MFFRFYASLLFLSLTLNSCYQKANESNRPQVLNAKNDPAKELNTIGSWANRISFGSNVLTIMDNGYFQFTSEGCIGKSFSEGKWELSGSDIICTSFDKYKAPDYFKQETTVSPQGSIKINGKNKKETKFISLVNTTNFSFPDTFKIYFDHKRFRIRNRMLYEILPPGISQEIVYRKDDKLYRLPNLHFPSPPDSLKE